jgi:hypothetical protein
VEANPRARTAAGLIALLALAGVTVLSLWSVLPPSPAGADAPADEFSAARAFTHIEKVGAQVRVAGSPAADAVRNYIRASLTGLGLQVEEQDSVGATDALGDTFVMARVRNLIAVLPGSDSTGRVFMIAQYDSVQVSYDGNDDGAGVATLLETARALTQPGAKRPRNDIVFVFTDAEEACLCGAEAFQSQHWLAAEGGVVLNFEARGASGPVITSTGNADVVDVYGDSVPYPVGTRFAVDVYRILPKDRDFSPFSDAGPFTGLNSAYTDGSAVYHSPQDTPSAMDRGALQHRGSNALALARAFGAADIAALATPASADSAYFPVLGQLVRYPGWLIWPIATIALLATIALVFVARRRGLTSWARAAGGFALAPIPLLAGPVLAQLLWTLLVALRPGYAEMIDPRQPGWFRAGVVALAALALLTWYGLLRRRLGPWSLALGGLGWLAVLGLVLAAAAPGGSYLAAIAAMAVSIAGVVALSMRPDWLRLVALGAGGAVAVVILAPTVLLFFPALGLPTGGAAAVFAAMLGLALLPVLEWLYPPRLVVPGPRRRPEASGPVAKETADAAAEGRRSVPVPGRPRRWRAAAPALLAGALAIALLATGLAVDQFDATHPATHPEPAQLIYVLDADTGTARWASDDAKPSAWVGQYITGREDLKEAFPILGDDLATGPAEAASLPAPELSVVSDTTSGELRMLSLSLRPQRPARLVYLQVRDIGVRQATVAARSVPTDRLEGGFAVLFHAPPPDGVIVTLVLAGTGPAKIRVLDGGDGLAGLPGFRPRPDGIGTEGLHDSELVVVAKTYQI